jgi:hypothetical protein
MKIAHFCLLNNSGMNNIARTLVSGESLLGLNSVLVDCQNPAAWPAADGADIHVVHTHIPDAFLHSGKPMVWVAHGTPEVMFQSGHDQGLINGAYGHGDAWMMAQYWLQHCDVTVTFWPRHQAIWKSLSDKKTRVECIPLGIDREFWKPVITAGKFAGVPSLITAENCYSIKRPLDLFIAWPCITREYHNARLHALYVPKDQHRWWFPLVNRNGCSFHAYIGPHVFSPENLRNAFCSTDFYIGLVRYGDFNRLSLEAASTGAKTISYRGNPYSDYHVTEGDQRTIAEELLAILGGKVEARVKTPVAPAAEMATAMVKIYESL